MIIVLPKLQGRKTKEALDSLLRSVKENPKVVNSWIPTQRGNGTIWLPSWTADTYLASENKVSFQELGCTEMFTDGNFSKVQGSLCTASEYFH